MRTNSFPFVFFQRRLLAGLLLAATAAWMPGCNKGATQVAVEGTITANGKPIEVGAISFTPIQPTTGPSAGAKIAAGRFSIAGPKAPVPGKYHVKITATRKTGKQVPDMLRPGKTVEGIEQFVPDMYNAKSKLEVDLREGDNNGVDFDLKI